MEFMLRLKKDRQDSVLRGRLLTSKGCIPGKYDCTLLINTSS